jgi:hypothetical protein
MDDTKYSNHAEMIKHTQELYEKYKERQDKWKQRTAQADLKDALEERMDIIGQNGNDGWHYDTMKRDDNFETPEHYDSEIQPWDFMESNMTEQAFEGFLKGNIIKYISRYEFKGGLQDLRKARHYLDKLIKVY